MSRNRVRPGVPEGGQFAATKRADADPSVALRAGAEIEASRDDERPATPYVLVSNERVENRPTLPVLDLDLLDQLHSDQTTYLSVDQLRATAEAVGRDDLRARAQKWLDEHSELRPEDHTPAPTPQLRQTRRDEAEGDPYVVLEFGAVANAPALPVIDLGFMVDWPSSDDLSDAHRAIDIANQVGLHDLAIEIDEWSAAYVDEDGYLADDD